MYDSRSGTDEAFMISFIQMILRSYVNSCRPMKRSRQDEYLTSRVCTVLCFFIFSPLPIARQHLSYGDCLEVKREYYQNSSVLDCVTQCSQSCNMVEWFCWDSNLISTTSCFLSVLWHCGLVIWPVKIIPEICVKWDVKPYTLTHFIFSMPC